MQPDSSTMARFVKIRFLRRGNLDHSYGIEAFQVFSVADQPCEQQTESTEARERQSERELHCANVTSKSNAVLPVDQLSNPKEREMYDNMADLYVMQSIESMCPVDLTGFPC